MANQAELRAALEAEQHVAQEADRQVQRHLAQQVETTAIGQLWNSLNLSLCDVAGSFGGHGTACNALHEVVAARGKTGNGR